MGVITNMTKADWLRSEIEKLEGMIERGIRCQGREIECDNYNEALTSIITRYKEELKVLESK